MVVNTRKKNSRQRGTKTHGWGSMKKHRGAGNRGGRGNAGSGKRGDAKKPSYDTIRAKVAQKVGFKPKRQQVKMTAITLMKLERNIDMYVSDGVATKKGDVYVINTMDIGYNKVLSNGKITKKFNITSGVFSKAAEEKVTAIGGKVVAEFSKETTSQVEEPSEKPVKKEKTEE